MGTLKFKTNIKCGGCISTVTPHLDALKGIENWNVDLENPNRILTVETSVYSESEIVETVTKAGYKIEKLK